MKIENRTGGVSEKQHQEMKPKLSWAFLLSSLFHFPSSINHYACRDSFPSGRNQGGKVEYREEEQICFPYFPSLELGVGAPSHSSTFFSHWA